MLLWFQWVNSRPHASNSHKMLHSSFLFSLQFFFGREWRESVKPCPLIQANVPPGTYLLRLLISHQGRRPKNFHQPPANTSGPDEAFLLMRIEIFKAERSFKFTSRGRQQSEMVIEECVRDSQNDCFRNFWRVCSHLPHNTVQQHQRSDVTFNSCAGHRQRQQVIFFLFDGRLHYSFVGWDITPVNSSNLQFFLPCPEPWFQFSCICILFSSF